MKILDLANNIWYGELQETTNTSISKIVAWLLAHVGDLNDHIGSSYQVSGNDITPELGDSESIILNYLYLLNYYNRQIQSNLGASAYDWSEVKEGDSSVRRVSRNEIAKTYKTLASDTKDYLVKLIEAYKRHHCISASIHSNIDAYTKILQQP